MKAPAYVVVTIATIVVVIIVSLVVLIFGGKDADSFVSSLVVLLNTGVSLWAAKEAAGAQQSSKATAKILERQQLSTREGTDMGLKPPDTPSGNTP